MAVEYYIKIQGCVVTLHSKNSGANVLKRLLVNPVFIDLWHEVTENEFDIHKWNKLNNTEKNYMVMLARKLNVDNKKLESANNNEATNKIERLKLLEGGILAGNMSQDIVTEALNIIDELADRQMLYRRTANALKKRITNASKSVENSINEIQNLRRKR